MYIEIYHLSFIIYHSSSIIYHLSFIIYHLSFIIYHLSFIIYQWEGQHRKWAAYFRRRGEGKQWVTTKSWRLERERLKMDTIVKGWQSTVIQNSLKMGQKYFTVPWAQEIVNKCARERVSAAEGASEVSSAEQANEWATWANEPADERVAHY